MIIQSKPKEEDVKFAIEGSGLKPTFTPCVLLQKGVTTNHLVKITQLPEIELKKAIVLLLNLFKIAYKRRFNFKRNNPDKWWY